MLPQMLEGYAAEICPEDDNQGVIMQDDNLGVNGRSRYTGEARTARGIGGDGVGTTQDRGGPKDRGEPNR